MKKVKISGMESEGKVLYVVLEENQNFFEWLSKLLGDGLGIVEDNIIYDKYFDKREIKRKKRRIKNLTDRHEKFKSKRANVEIFYGKNKAILILRAPLEKRKKFMDVLEKISTWKKPK